MATPDPITLAAALERVAPGSPAPRVSPDGGVSAIVDVSGLSKPARERVEAQVRAALAAVPSVAGVRVLLTAEKADRRLIAVGSGKGGVGKSTLSANLAIALHRLGVPTGLVDADIYGPSQPRLMAAAARPESQDQQMIPVETKFGVPMLSMGQLVDPGKAIAWRGPMAASALGQLVDARWRPGTLVVDLPPGTGDVQLTMIQKHRPAGAVIVSTPQDLALIDAARAVDLFNQAGVPILGVVENMAGYACPCCGEVSYPFGTGGAEAEAGRLGLRFLGRVPLDLAIRAASDAGTPPAAADDDRAEPFLAIARALLAAMEPDAG